MRRTVPWTLILLLLCLAWLNGFGEGYARRRPDRERPIPAERPDWSTAVRPLALKAAGEIAGRIQKRFTDNPQAKPYRIVVFPFGDKGGKIDMGNYEQAFHIKGVLDYEISQELLRRGAKGKFAILDKYGLQRELEDARVDPSDLSTGNPKLRDILARLHIGAAVFGTTQSGEEGNSAEPVVFFTDGAPGNVRIPPSMPVNDRYSHGPNSSLGYGSLELLVGEGDEFRKAPVYRDKRVDRLGISPVLYALIPDRSEGKEFMLRIGSTGKSGIAAVKNRDQSKDRERLLGVVVTVDGVNSFYQDLGDGKVQPVVVHPKNARKWVLSPPGYRIEPARNEKGYQLKPVEGAGHSVIDIKGFQRDGRSALAFTFGPASGKKEFAEKLGVTREIGVVTATFFPEEFPGDVWSYAKGGPSHLGAFAGRKIEQPIFTIRPKFHRKPVASITLFYRTKADFSIPQEQRLRVDE